MTACDDARTGRRNLDSILSASIRGGASNPKRDAKYRWGDNAGRQALHAPPSADAPAAYALAYKQPLVSRCVALVLARSTTGLGSWRDRRGASAASGIVDRTAFLLRDSAAGGNLFIPVRSSSWCL